MATGDANDPYHVVLDSTSVTVPVTLPAGPISVVPDSASAAFPVAPDGSFPVQASVAFPEETTQTVQVAGFSPEWSAQFQAADTAVVLLLVVLIAVQVASLVKSR